MAAVVVAPDGGGQGQDALQDTGERSGWAWPPWRSRSSGPLRVSPAESMDLAERPEELRAGLSEQCHQVEQRHEPVDQVGPDLATG